MLCFAAKLKLSSLQSALCCFVRHLDSHNLAYNKQTVNMAIQQKASAYQGQSTLFGINLSSAVNLVHDADHDVTLTVFFFLVCQVH